MSTVNAPQPRPSFYTAGGTMDPMASSYIERRADKDLLEAVMAGRFCYILTSRQTGKSSLMMRTASKLQGNGIKSVIIDLTARSTSNATIEQWYLEQVLEIAEQLGLDEDPFSWWEKESKLSVVRRFTAFFTQVVLKRIAQPVVIFVDEIDSTLSLPFNCDDYFAVIRSLYNKRATDPALKRLTFVLLGVASPSDIIKDARRTPFNIGIRIQLNDFTKEEAQPLRSGLAPDEQSSGKILEDILFFTGGHPYLTQKTCLRVAQWAESYWNEEESSRIVQKLVEEMFQSEKGQASDDNIQFIRKRILSSKVKNQLLQTYRAILQGEVSPDNELDPLLMELKLSGLVKVDGEILVVRNTIYESVFSETWIRNNRLSPPPLIQKAIDESVFDETWTKNNRPSPPPLIRSALSILQFILIFLGIPGAALAAFLTKNLLLAVGITLLYEVAVFVLAFLGKVWGRLESPLVDGITIWLDQQILNSLSRYRRQYYRYLIYQHRDFDVKGLSTQGTYTLELEQVFVELRIDSPVTQLASENPFQLSQTLLEGSHSIWDYLASAAISNQHLVIIGPPGSGKSSLLKHIVLTLAASRRPEQLPRGSKVSRKVPILLFLRDHARAITEQEDFSLVDAVHDHLRRRKLSLSPEGWLRRQLQRGNCLVMLDGLDEVADFETRRKVAAWVERQKLGWGRNRFLVTSRPIGYRSNPLANVAVLQVQSFSSAQVEQFINRWYLANEIMSRQKDDPGVLMRARAEARSLLQRLRATPALFELTVNPLLLTMIATIHRYRGELPGRRVLLYAEICEVFLGKRQEARGQILELSPAQMQLVLEPLAYHMMTKGVRDISLDEAGKVIKKSLAQVSPHIFPETFLRMVEQVSGLLLERENEIYSFASQTFQEYLTACYLKEKQLSQVLVTHIQDSWWRETIRLYCAMGDASPIIEACLAEVHPSAAVIELAVDCVREALSVRPEARSKLETLLEVGLEDSDPERQHVVAGALLARRLGQMVHLTSETYGDSTFITCAEYQIFLDEQRVLGRYYQPDHWASYHFPPAQGRNPVLGIRSSDATAFCEWLTEREFSPWSYRLPKLGELEEEKIPDLLPWGTGYWLEENEKFAWARNDRELPAPRFQEAIAELFLSIDLALDRASSLVNNLDGNPEQVHALSLALDRASSLVNNLDGNPEQVHALSLALARVCDLARNGGSNFVNDLVIARDLVLGLQRSSGFVPDLALDLQRVSDLPHNLAFDLGRDLTGIRNLDRARMSILQITSPLLLEKRQKRSQRKVTFSNSEQNLFKEEDNQHSIRLWGDLYISLVLIEERIKGNLPAYEGILIMKERK
jgi:energy-coupling factor transporter ATP-binding protein EcfA2